jgi:ribosome maturation factor RimP
MGTEHQHVQSDNSSCPLLVPRLRAFQLLDIVNMLGSGPRGSGDKTLCVFYGESVADIAVLTQMIAPHAESLGLSLVRVAMFGGTSDPTLQVMAERPDTRQLTIEDCAALSRLISETLDETDPIEAAYRLEVSSPGIDRPLTRLADFADWTGHDARISLSEEIDGRKRLDARIDGVEDSDVRVTILKSGSPMRIAFEVIASAKLLLTDRLIAATAPISPEGADRISKER